MGTSRLLVLMMLASVALLVMAGCGGDDTVLKDTGIESMDGAPKWVLMGGAAFPDDEGKAFYGVGSAPKMKDRSMQRQRAKLRATEDLASQIETYVSSLQKDYAYSASDGDAETVEDQFEVVRKQVTRQNLSGVQASQFWFDKENGEMYVLVKMDLAALKDRIENAKELNRQVRQYIKENADRLHDELRLEEEKNR